jgi:hypothetical protein
VCTLIDRAWNANPENQYIFVLVFYHIQVYLTQNDDVDSLNSASNVLLQFILSVRICLVNFALQVSPQIKITCRQVWRTWGPQTDPRVRYDTVKLTFPACRLAILALLSVTIWISTIFIYRYLTSQLVTFGQWGCVVPFFKMPGRF